jgi:hypothetical protein
MLLLLLLLVLVHVCWRGRGVVRLRGGGGGRGVVPCPLRLPRRWVSSLHSLTLLHLSLFRAPSRRQQR